VRVIVNNTVAVMTGVPEKRDEWRQAIAGAREQAQQGGVDWQIEVEFFDAIINILNGQPINLPENHPYGPAIAAIRQGISGGQP
jgi:hypothetical protein